MRESPRSSLHDSEGGFPDRGKLSCRHRHVQPLLHRLQIRSERRAPAEWRLCCLPKVLLHRLQVRPEHRDKDRKNNLSIDIVVRVSVWSLSGSMSVREQTYRGRGDVIWSRQS